MFYLLSSGTPAVDDLMNPLDRKFESGSNSLQRFTLSIALTDEVVACFFGNMLLGERHLRYRYARIEAFKQPTYSGIQGG